jgi:glycosyltransferase involved in cell wall biosynthesis
MRHARVDLVHTNSLKSDLLGGVAARLAGLPVIWHVRDRLSSDYLPRRVGNFFKAMARRIPAAVVANSAATLATLDPAGDPPRVGRKPALIVHDGTHLPVLVPPRRTADQPCVVGLVGRLAPWKGQHVFIEAAARVRARFPEARFRIIGAALFGENEYERGLRESVGALGLNETVEFSGFRSDVGQAIAELDVVVHASTTGEPFGQVIIEGMATAKPVIATRGGGVPEIVVDGQTGILVPMNDAAEMARAIEWLLGDAALRDRIGLAGRARVEALFTMDRVAADMQRVFDRVLAD